MTLRLANAVFAAAGLALASCAQHSPESAPAAAAPPLVSQPSVGQEVGAVVQNNVTVTFPEGGYSLSADANTQLDVAARLFRDVNPVTMYSIGYSDATGNEFDNVILSARRARAVKQGLIARGIPADRVQIQAFGESEPAEPAAPQARANRRVVVMWRIV